MNIVKYTLYVFLFTCSIIAREHTQTRFEGIKQKYEQKIYTVKNSLKNSTNE